MFPCISWEGSSLSRFPTREKIPPFQVVQERSCPGAVLFEKIIFLEQLKKISYFRVLFWERSSFTFCLGVRSYSREKEISYFPIIQERSNYRAIFLERPSFHDVWKKKIWFSVQCFLVTWIIHKQIMKIFYHHGNIYRII